MTTSRPPTDCAAVTNTSPYSPGPSCTPVGPDIWRTGGNGETSYFIRHNDAVAVIQADAYQVPDQTLAALARTMTVRSPSYFTG